MEQTLFNWAIVALGALLGLIVRFLWAVVIEIQTEHKKLADRVSAIDVLVAGKYITREETTKFSERIFAQLNSILEKLDSKADKDDCHTNHGKA
jgi:hypothetical protein